MKKFSWIKHFVSDYKGIFREIQWFLYYRSVIKKASKTIEFKKNLLRLDWIYRIYTVININLDEAMYPAEEQRKLIIDKLGNVHEYFKKIQIEDLLDVSDKAIPTNNGKILLTDTEEVVAIPPTSFLIVYNFAFDKLTWWTFVKHIILFLGIYYYRENLIDFYWYVVSYIK